MDHTKKPATSSAPTSKASDGFTADEKALMKEVARERKALAGKADGTATALAAIAAMPEADRALAERIHAIATEAAPVLSSRTWYGMPAYVNEAGKVICFFQAASKFKVRYATLGFQHDARLDDGEMWPTSFAVTALTPAVEARITELVKKAAG